MLSAQQRLEAVQKARSNISDNAKKLEMEMSRWRVRCAEEARQTAEKEEREVALSLFNEANPSDAVTLKAANCLLYTSDAADEEDSVDLGGRRIIKKKNTYENTELINVNKYIHK
eukprot:TRINITY_DN22210_c0_g1_i1.p2 TRINITY_DN22210_c0_g1~~TRINITY_DN22210_c0_g1_i1.p2  ORF type:complete len:115 (-),score=34.93 TRINITY_DN22210_c0_g1_i1:9-353(-)